jgi:peptidase M48-like protein
MKYLLAIAMLGACATHPQYLGARVPHPCTTHDVEGCLGWMAERDLAAAELDIYEDAALRDYVQHVADRLARGSLVGAAPRVVIADHDDTYATSGRRIVIGRATIEKLATEAELAAVIAHELAHVEARHGVVSLFGRPPDDGLAARRDAEAIADERAVALLERAGYSPSAMGRALRAVLDVEDDEHPAREDRITRVDAIASGRSGFEGRDELLQHIQHMVVGRDPRLGHRIGDTWVVSALDLAFDIDEADVVRAADDILAVRRGHSTIVAYAVGTPWDREIAASLEDRSEQSTKVGRIIYGAVPHAGKRATSPLDKLAEAVRATLPQPSPGTRIALVERPHGTLLIELGGRTRPPLQLRAAAPIELAAARPTRMVLTYATRAGTIGELDPCHGRLLDDPARRIAAGAPIKCADPSATPLVAADPASPDDARSLGGTRPRRRAFTLD